MPEVVKTSKGNSARRRGDLEKDFEDRIEHSPHQPR